ncbi:hypothetical protein [Microbacterium sp. P05]|uniref:hypothetical protein n=1 Tax=Microbacterium sp. P05 TaxID=3366948 RepID=UPI003745CD06
MALLVVVLVSAITVLPRALAVADDDRLADAMDPATTSAAEITLSTRWGDTVGGGEIVSLLAKAADEFPSGLEEPLRSAVGPARLSVVLDPRDVDVPGPGGEAIDLRLGVEPDLLPTAQVIDGVLPAAWDGSGPLDIALQAAVADRLGATVGSALPAQGLELRVSAVIDAPEAGVESDGSLAVFRDVAVERLESGGSVLAAGAWVDPGSLGALESELLNAQLTARLPIGADGLSAADIPALAASVRAASSTGAALPRGEPLYVSSRLPSILDRVAAAQANTTALAWLLASSTLGAVVVAMLLAARAYADRRSAGRRLLSARGAGATRLFREGVVDAAIAVVPAALLGAGIAVAAVMTGVGSGAPDFVLVALVGGVAVAIGGVAALTLPEAWRTPVRLGLDVVLLALGVTAASLLVTRGFATPGNTVDPFLLTAPVWIAIAGGVIGARMLPLALRGAESAGRRTAGAARRVALAWAARRPSGVLPFAAIVVALTAAVSCVVVGSALADALSEAARAEVGADARIVGGDEGASPEEIGALPGVAAVATVRVLDSLDLTDGGRTRSATVLVADTAALHAVRPDLPVLAAGEIAIPPVLADGFRQQAELAGAPVQTSITSATMPISDGRWVLVDASSLTEIDLSGAVWVLCRWDEGSAGDPAAAVRAVAGENATVLVATEVRAAAAAQPAPSILTTVLVTGAILPIILAALAVAASVAADAPERRRLSAILRLLGLPGPGGWLPALWQVVPLVLAGTIVGGIGGLLVAALVHGAVDIARVAGAETAGVSALTVPWAVVLAVVAGSALLLIGAGTAAARPGARPAERRLVESGAS